MSRSRIGMIFGGRQPDLYSQILQTFGRPLIFILTGFTQNVPKVSLQDFIRQFKPSGRGGPAYEAEGRFRKAKVRSQARLAAASL
jgi:hypothetical protein